MVAQYPREKASYYCVGFTDWSIVYPAVAAVRAAAGMSQDDGNFIVDAAARRNPRDRYGPIIDEGMRMMGVALRMDPNYSDAMAYLNLLYRMKANLADSAAESADAVSEANEWVGKAIDANRIAPDSSPRGVTGAAAPPPPPPPPPPQISDTALASDAPAGSPQYGTQC
jgi:hypothetical protein